MTPLPSAMTRQGMEPSKASSIEHPKSEHKLSRLEIEIHRGKAQEVTGHTVRHSFEPEMNKHSPAFSSVPDTASYVFDGNGHSSSHGHMADHLQEHLPHVFGETTGGKKGMIEANNKPGQGDDDEESSYEG